MCVRAKQVRYAEKIYEYPLPIAPRLAGAAQFLATFGPAEAAIPSHPFDRRQLWPAAAYP
jgi:hypothetical protein